MKSMYKADVRGSYSFNGMENVSNDGENTINAYQRLIQSEQQRIRLEMELRSMMARSNKSERLKALQLRSQLEGLKVQRQQSLQRNQAIKKQMMEFDANLISVSTKTQRLRMLKNEYEEYIEKNYPNWKQQFLTKAELIKEKDLKLSSLRRDVSPDFREQDSLSSIFREDNENFSQGVPFSSSFTSPSQAGRNTLYAGDANLTSQGTLTRILDADDTSHSNSNEAGVDRSAMYNLPKKASSLDLVDSRYDRSGTFSASLRSSISEKSVKFSEAGVKISESYSYGTPHQKESSGRFSAPDPLTRSSPSPSELLRMSRQSSVSLKSVNVTQNPPDVRKSVSHTPSMERIPAAEARHTASPLQKDMLTQPTTQISTMQSETESLVVSEKPAGIISKQSSSTSSVTSLRIATEDAVKPTEQTTPSTGELGKMGTAEVTQPIVAETETLQIDSKYRKPSDIDDKENHIDQTQVASPDMVKGNAAPAQPLSNKEPALSQSFSVTDSANEEDQIDVTQTEAFKNLLSLSGSLTKNSSIKPTADSDSSDESWMNVEKAYKEIVLTKTNTIPLGQSLKRETSEEGSESDESDSVDLKSPMGYTPSFAVNSVKKDSQPPSHQGSGKANVGRESLNLSTGGGSTATSASGPMTTGKTTSSSRKSVLRKTESDVESESDLQSSNAKEDTEQESDFDFYG